MPFPGEQLSSSDWEDHRTDVLSWLPGNTPVYRGINIKQVRVSDSPTHYHPQLGGFDELVFIRDTEPGAGVLISTQREAIETHTLTRTEVGTLLQPIPLHPGDLLFLPRGTIHRARGRSSAVVLALPGFLPGAEVRLDEDLRAINEALGLKGDAALPTYAGVDRGSGLETDR